MTASKPSRRAKSGPPPLPADYWLGVDIAKNTFTASLAPVGFEPAAWRTLLVREFSNDRAGIDALVVWMKERAPERSCLGVCVESTGAYSGFFSDLLGSTSLPPVSVLNPLRSVRFGQSLGARDKSDRVDAAILAVFGVVQRPAPSRRPDPTLRRMRDLDRIRQSVAEDLVAWGNRLEQASDPVVRRHLSKVRDDLKRSLERIDSEIRELTEAESDAARQIALLRSVPAIGPRGSVALTAEFGDLSHYSRDELVSAGGVFPREHSSGTSVHRKPRMACGGGARVRRVLYMGAVSVLHSRSALGLYAARLLAAGKPRMVVIGALMRRILLVARAVVVSGKPYDPVQAARTEPFRTPAASAAAA